MAGEMMDSVWRTTWITHGRPTEDLSLIDGLDNEADILLQRHGAVKVSANDQRGTTVTWAVFAPNWSSLYFVMETLYLYPSPYRLQYFLAGWFSEDIEECRAARDRIHALMAKSDIHLLTRTFVKAAVPDAKSMPPLLQDAWSDRSVKPDYSIDCVHDENDDRYKVMRIGPNSPIAKAYGMMPVSYPCLNGGSYDQVVSEIYPKVIKTGEPYYGHVYAAMAFPNRQIRWVPYQRVVLPHLFPDGRPGVTVVSEVSPVDIQVV